MKIGLVGRGKVNKEFLEVYENASIISDNWDEIVDIVIDFSHPKYLDRILTYCLKNSIKLVIGTTGYNELELLKIKEAGKKISVFISPNFSLGINKLKNVLNYFNDYKIYIIEAHQKNKIDLPSGTALLLKENQNIENIFSIREGEIMGMHELLLVKDFEMISIRHNFFSRKIFIEGAIEAAKKLLNTKVGYYDKL